MRTRTVTNYIGEDMGPVDWSHATAVDKPDLWREAEKNPGAFAFNGRDIYRICMYDGWPYWTPTPAIFHEGPICSEWSHFNSYGVYAGSIQPRRQATST